MCSAPCALQVAFSSLPSISSSRSHGFGTHVPSPSLHHVRSARVVRIRAEGGAGSEKEETTAGENAKSGAAAVTDASSSKGFGASARPAPASSKEKKKKPGTIRRSAPQAPLLQSAPADNQVSQIETAYVVSLTFLFGLIFVEGLTLAASGFLPEEWDQFLVDKLYPSFTPTVGLFLVGAAGYGVFKYLGLGPSKE